MKVGKLGGYLSPILVLTPPTPLSFSLLFKKVILMHTKVRKLLAMPTGVEIKVFSSRSRSWALRF